MLRKFSSDELIAFLKAMDQHLTGSHDIVVMGGGALALAYNARYRTKDIDTFHTPDPAVMRAAQLAMEETKLPIPFGPAGIGDVPYYAEERVEQILGDELKHLRVFVLERHDVAISKTLRGEAVDLQAIRALHEEYPLDPDILIGRYLSETDHITIGRQKDRDLQFLNLLDFLFGPEIAERARKDMPSISGRRRQHGRYP